MGREKTKKQFSNDFIIKRTDQINRGGLIQPNVEFCGFIKHINLVAKNLITFQFLRK